MKSQSSRDPFLIELPVGTVGPVSLSREKTRSAGDDFWSLTVNGRHIWRFDFNEAAGVRDNLKLASGAHKDHPVHKMARMDMVAQSFAWARDWEINAIVKRFREAVIGKKVVVLSGYNGQPFGNSRRSLKGTTQTVIGATWNSDGWHLQLEGERLFIEVQCVEFLEPVE